MNMYSIGTVKDSTDRLVVRWVQMQLKRGHWNGMQYTRKFENFHDDLRDGKSLQVLLKVIEPSLELLINDDENSRDFAERVENVLYCATQLGYPVKNFATSSHIMGKADSIVLYLFHIYICII